MDVPVENPTHDVPEPEPHITAAGGVVYRWTSSGQLQILLIKKQKGFWTLPKGQVKDGEDDRSAVAREVSEETNISGQVGAMVRQVYYTIQKGGRVRGKTVTYYLVQADAGRPRPQAKERIIRVRWFPIAVALRRIQRKRIRNIVREAESMLVESAREAGT